MAEPGGIELVRQCREEVSSLEAVSQGPQVPLDRRRHALGQLLRSVDGQRPIVAEFDFEKGRGWRKALRRVTVTHVSLCQTTVAGEMVAGTVDAGSGQTSGHINALGAAARSALSIEDLVRVPD